MLADFVSKIADLAKQGTATEKIKLPGGKLLLRFSDGLSQTMDCDRTTTSVHTSELESLIEWCGDDGECIESGELRILIGSGCVTAIAWQGLYRESRSVLGYRLSAALEDLEDWCGDPRSLKQVVAALRTELSGCFSGDYLSVFRRMDFSRKNDGTKSVSHKGESLGRSVETLAQSAAGDIPEQLVFTLPIYDNIPCDPSKLIFALDVDPSTETIQIAAVSDCVERAKRAARQQLKSIIQDAIPGALVLHAI